MVGLGKTQEKSDSPQLQFIFKAVSDILQIIS
jgi:hypothetical protein